MQQHKHAEAARGDGPHAAARLQLCPPPAPRSLARRQEPDGTSPSTPGAPPAPARMLRHPAAACNFATLTCNRFLKRA